ncbi:phytase [Echinimonas agarilytica]|uniref:Phytase n=1 Tax=Echinimonas agarilytica TaxID=1215918 RepID=A0AA41W3L7_9GAMM|nr:phytase [Echinimonas agarilytica]MCM2678201.1 phytase [Echinimonas agarilytica]
MIRSLTTLALVAAGCLLMGCESTSLSTPLRMVPNVEFSRQTLILEHGNVGLTEQGITWSVGAQSGVVAGDYHGLEARQLGDLQLFATITNSGHGLALFEWSANGPIERQQTKLTTLLADEQCLYVSAASQSLYSFVQDGRGASQQWLLAYQGKVLPEAKLVRQLPVGYNSSACGADDERGYVYLVEEDVAVWRYRAEPEAMPERAVVAMPEPWGNIAHDIEAIRVLPTGDIFALMPSQLMQLKPESADFNSVTKTRVWSLPTQAAEQFNVTVSAHNEVEIRVFDEAENRTYSGLISTQFASLTAVPVMTEVTASFDTAPASQTGDAMDDPAIWIHPTDRNQSLVLGTHKKQGLYVYNLQGDTLQRLEDGRLNNVDVRTVDSTVFGVQGVAVASRRDDNSVIVYGIDAQRKVFQLLTFDTPLSQIYGICMGVVDGAFSVFPNDKDGRVLQYSLSYGGHWNAVLKRTLQVASQPEGCVVSDAQQRLFVGEEGTGVWETDASASGDSMWQSVVKIGDLLKADVEGISIAKGTPDLLVMSSQGNDSYVVIEAVAPYRYRGRFRIGLDPQTGIDGASETDGLDVTSMALNAEFPKGLLVVQDGRNLMPDQPQNFKFVSWQKVLETLEP